MDAATWLQANDLGTYAQSITQNEGWEDLNDLINMADTEKMDLAREVGMKKGHAAKFVRLLSTERLSQPSDPPIPPIGEPSFGPGTVLLGNFVLEVDLGGGGMGQVYRAHDKILGRKVAIKIAKSGISAHADKELEQRMKQEVQAVAQCSHERIMAIHSAHLDEPIPFIVCGFLGDITLLALQSARSPLLTPHNLQLVSEHLLDALAFVHSKKWIHRDVKPGNVMWVPQDGSRFHAKLIDFGIAKSITSQSNVIQTTTCSIPGTRPYMGPLARNGILDARSDLWAVGITVAECLMGEVPGEIHPLEILADAVSGMLPSKQNLQRKWGGSENDKGLEALVLTLQRALAVPQHKGFANAVAFLESIREGKQEGPPSPVAHGTDMHAVVEQSKIAAWAFARRIEGLDWHQESAQLKVSEFECGPVNILSAPQQNAVQEIWGMIKAIPGNQSLDEMFSMTKLLLAHSSSRSISLCNKLEELSSQLHGAHEPGAFRNLRVRGDETGWAQGKHDGRGAEGTGSSAEAIEWRVKVMEKLKQYDASALHNTEEGQVRVLLAFHVPSSMDVAKLILKGNMAELSSVDAGYFGKALYFSLDALYSLLEYGEGYYNMQQIPLLLCAVVVGNGYPVIESPYQQPPADVNVVNNVGHLGQPIMSGADHHFTVVAKDDTYHGRAEPLPVPPAKWEQYLNMSPQKLWTELVVKEAAQVLPIAVATMENNKKLICCRFLATSP